MVKTIFCLAGKFEINKGISPNLDFSALYWLFPIVLGIILILLILQVIGRLYFKFQRNVHDWKHLDELIQKKGLTTEETSFLHVKLRQLRYKNPSHILQNRVEYQKFVKLVLKRPNHHYEYMLNMIKAKVFDKSSASSLFSQESEKDDL